MRVTVSVGNVQQQLSGELLGGSLLQVIGERPEQGHRAAVLRCQRLRHPADVLCHKVLCKLQSLSDQEESQLEQDCLSLSGYFSCVSQVNSASVLLVVVETELHV